MIDNIRKSLHSDLWKIIEEGELEEKSTENFLVLLFYIFLEKKEFTIKEIVDLASQLKHKYYKILENSKELAIIGEPIKAIKNIDEQFPKLVNKILEKFNATN